MVSPFDLCWKSELSALLIVAEQLLLKAEHTVELYSLALSF